VQSQLVLPLNFLNSCDESGDAVFFDIDLEAAGLDGGADSLTKAWRDDAHVY
jgi:hypothetical protein